MQDDVRRQLSARLIAWEEGGFQYCFEIIVALDPWFSPCKNSKILALEIVDTVDSILDIIIGMELCS